MLCQGDDVGFVHEVLDYDVGVGGGYKYLMAAQVVRQGASASAV